MPREGKFLMMISFLRQSDLCVSVTAGVEVGVPATRQIDK